MRPVPAEQIEALIRETARLRKWHLQREHFVDAAAAAIREKALRECLAIVTGKR